MPSSQDYNVHLLSPIFLIYIALWAGLCGFSQGLPPASTPPSWFSSRNPPVDPKDVPTLEKPQAPTPLFYRPASSSRIASLQAEPLSPAERLELLRQSPFSLLTHLESKTLPSVSFSDVPIHDPLSPHSPPMRFLH